MPSSRDRLQAIATALIDNDRIQDVQSELFQLLDDLGEYVCTCERCEELCSPDDTGYVDESETWCNSCVESHAFHCDHCHTLCSGDSTDVDGEAWCDGCREDAYYWESDGEWHTEPEPEEPDGSDIPGYHELTLDIDRIRLSKPDVLGIELETYQPEIDAAGEYFATIRERFDRSMKFERDGSLDSQFGVELVCQPYTLAELRDDDKSPWHAMLNWSRSHGAKSWDAGKGYGMHVSLNGAALQPCHRARIVRFFNDNRTLCEELAGRTQTQWAEYCVKSKLSDEAKPTQKYQAAANRGPRIEVRIFRGTLNWERFVRNCEFVDAVRVYTQDCGCSDRTLSASAFKAWMAKPENRTSYPGLAQVLNVSRKRAKPQSVDV